MKKSFILLSVLIAIFLFSCWNIEIKKNQGYSIAKITRRLGHAKGGYSVEYQYKVGNIFYIGSISPTFYSCKFDAYFQDKYFPVVYSKKDPEKSILLVKPEDFQEFGYEFPDSLNWVKDCL